MSADKAMENFKTAAEQAEEMENQAKAEPDIGTYVHTFKNPVNYQGTVIEELIFNWGNRLRPSVHGTPL